MSDLSSETAVGRRVVVACERLVSCIALTLVALASGALFGWMLDLRFSQIASPDWHPMQPSGAMALLLAAAALLGSRQRNDAVSRERILPILITSAGGASLALSLFGWISGTRPFILVEAPWMREAVPLGPMPVNTALSILLVGLAFVYIDHESSNGRRPSEWLAFGAALPAFVALVGYAFDVPVMTSLFGAAPMALHAAFAVALLTVGLLAARPDAGGMRWLGSTGPEGMAARVLLPASAGMVVLLGFLAAAGKQHGLYGSDMRGALFFVATVSMLVVVLVRSIAWLSASETARRAAETERDVSRRRFASIVNSSMDAIISVDASHRIVLFNPAAEAMFRCKVTDALGTPLDRFIPERLRAAHAKHVARFFEAGSTSRRMGEFLPLSGLRSDGVEFPMEASITRALIDGDGLATVTLRDISERRQLEERIRQTAQHDPLTKLANRALIYEHGERLLAGARRGDRRAAFLFIDLDRFKPINDSHGHHVGDVVLQETARRLTVRLREQDLAGRLGGDEFVVVLADIQSDEDAAKIALYFLEHLGYPYFANGRELRISSSIGISVFPRDGDSVDELIKHADSAMYQAKRAGRNDYRFFCADGNSRAETALRIESRLRKGLEFREFELHFQPIVDLGSKRMVGAEALVRWPAMKVGPEEFVPVAETAGFMPALGGWILREACRQWASMQKTGLQTMPVAVNVSPNQFRQKDFLKIVAKALDESGLAASDLKVEITESLAMQNMDESVKVLGSLRDMGIMVALDDFGTGYSSLSYLTRLPIDILKLDQSFVKNLGRDANSAIVADSILALAKSLSLTVVAEGIESQEALAFLEQRRCPHGQGFRFSPPLPMPKFEEWCLRQAS